SGESAISMLTEKKYDILFMDHMMPGMDGIEATKKIRLKGGDYVKLPIIALTANAVSGMREMFLMSGFNDFLAKPVDIPLLNAMLGKWIPADKQKKATKAQAAPEAPTFEIEGLDVTSGIKNTGGRTDNYIKTLTFFVKDAIEKRDEIPRCLAKGETRLYITFVHALKSALASIGSPGLSKMAALLERAGNEGDAAQIHENTPGFLEELAKLIEKIQAFLIEVESKRKKDTKDTEFLCANLLGLTVAIQDLRLSDAEEIIGRIENSQASELVREVSECILISDYDAAVERIYKYINELEI
ncbi:MAG: response regulator, partial [Defluviitaleaceae bacterium]|nr:response regulator [Defluviitaleaceae bacterium]